MFYRIVNRDFKYPNNFSSAAKSCISGLLRKKEDERLGSSELGAKEIMQSEFFAVMDFERLLNKAITPPFKPDVTDEQDTTYVPESLLRTEAKDSISDVKVNEKSTQFEAFTFAGDKALDEEN